ncbi:MAG TPA: hypothetical protein VHF47_13830 [Acidimicrobiales bacterium]|nr:hypothetical protein [Acidimicrobiales bacterium]
MHARRRLLGWAALALASSAAYPVATGSAPASAHTGYTSIGDTSSADVSPDPTINGTTVQVRILRPSTDALKPGTGWPLVVYMAGDFKNRCANINENSTRTSWYTRTQLAEHGFSVLSFNARGLPANFNAGYPSGSRGCDASEDAKDGIDDSGWDYAGTTDKTDLKELVDWAVANYTWSGCASSCIDGDRVGLFGYGALDASKALMMAVPNPPNGQFSSRVKGVVAVGYEDIAVRNLAAVSSDGTTFRDVDHGTMGALPDHDAGYYSHADPSVLSNFSKLLAGKYLNTTVPTATTTWFDDRTFVDDDVTTADGDVRVDKAGLVTDDMAVFMANSFLDDAAGITTATLAFNKLGTTKKYLYLGACGSGYGQLSSSASGPCLTTNAGNLRDKVHAFLDRHVKGDTAVSVGGPLFWAVPPATNPLSTDGWSVATDAVAAWPPSTNPADATTLDYCLDSAGEWHSGLCSAVPNGTGTGLQDTADRTVANVLTIETAPPGAFCSGSTFGPTEVVSYTTSASAADYKLIGAEVDVRMSSTSSRLQAVAQLVAVTPGSPETETTITQGAPAVVPVVRNGTAGTIYRFKFKPFGNGWTLKTGDKLRLKIAANWKTTQAQELIPATYTVKHTDTNPFTVKLTFDL